MENLGKVSEYLEQNQWTTQKTCWEDSKICDKFGEFVTDLQTGRKAWKIQDLGFSIDNPD